MRKYGISRLALIAALTAAPGLAQAQDAAADDDGDTVVLDTVSLTASSVPVALSRTGATVDIVTAEDLQKAGDISVASQLARLPGVSMTRNGGMGTSTALRLRGLSGPYIGVRIDGIDVADPSGTQCAYDFGSTTTGGISRIEVLRGSQSALYGSEAIGGVVDITTYRAEKQGVSGKASLEVGSNATYSGSAAIGVKGERGELAFSVSRTVTDGISAYADGTEDDAFRATFVTAYAAYDLTETLRVGVNGFYRNSHTDYDGFASVSPYGLTDTADTEEGKLRGARVFAQFETGAVSHELSLSRTETRRYYPLGYTQQYDGDRNQIAYNGRWEQSQALTLTWGLDRTKETFTSDSDGGDARTNAVFAEALFAPRDDLDLSLAVRRDDHDVFGGKTTGRAALAWRPTEDWVIRAVASTGFRAPSLYELYSAYYGNPDLTPETSRSFELGAEYILPFGGSIQATLFDTKIKDKIEWSSATYTYAQVPGDSRVRGVELTGRAQVTQGWEVFGNYTYTDAKSDGTSGGARLSRVPRHDLVLGVEGRIAERITALASVQYVADVLDAGTPLPDYTVVNVGVNYAINDTTEAYLRVENLFDEDYQTVRDYGQPGRQVFVGVRTSF